MTRRLYVGTLQDPAKQPSGESGAVYTIDLDGSRPVRPAGFAPSLRAPTYLALHPAAEVFFVVSGDGRGEGSVSSCAIDPFTGDLKVVRTLPSGGVEPCHLSLSPHATALVVANYGVGTVASFLLDGDGHLDRPGEVTVHHGEGPHRERQTRAHPHMAAFDLLTGNLLVPDLGIDQVVLYGFDEQTGQLQARPDLAIKLAPGAGPRHVAFLPSGGGAVVANELDSTVVLLSRQQKGFEVRDTISVLAEDNGGENYPSAIRVSQDGSLVYVANRGQDNVATLRVVDHGRRLELAGYTGCGGQWPRDLLLDAEAGQLLIANQNTNAVTSLGLDATGLPSDIGRHWSVDAPACLVMWNR